MDKIIHLYILRAYIYMTICIKLTWVSTDLIYINRSWHNSHNTMLRLAQHDRVYGDFQITLYVIYPQVPHVG